LILSRGRLPAQLSALSQSIATLAEKRPLGSTRVEIFLDRGALSDDRDRPARARPCTLAFRFS
jgi:hypothetical protein